MSAKESGTKIGVVAAVIAGLVVIGQCHSDEGKEIKNANGERIGVRLHNASALKKEAKVITIVPNKNIYKDDLPWLKEDAKHDLYVAQCEATEKPITENPTTEPIDVFTFTVNNADECIKNLIATQE